MQQNVLELSNCPEIGGFIWTLVQKSQSSWMSMLVIFTEEFVSGEIFSGGDVSIACDRMSFALCSRKCITLEHWECDHHFAGVRLFSRFRNVTAKLTPCCWAFERLKFSAPEVGGCSWFRVGCPRYLVELNCCCLGCVHMRTDSWQQR